MGQIGVLAEKLVVWERREGSSCWGEGLGGRGGEQRARDLTVLPTLSLCCLGHPPPCAPSFQVAVIAGNFELGELIRNHREQDVGEQVGGGAKGRP